MTGRQLLDFHGRLAGMPAEERRRRAEEVIELVGLPGRGGERIRGYSKGMTQRIGLAQALMARPELVILDEPTSALDPLGRREVRDLIRGLKAEGTTVFLNSHLLGEVEMVCDRVAIVDKGRVVRSGRLDDLVGALPELRLTVEPVDEALMRLLGRFGDARCDGAGVVLSVDDVRLGADVAEAVVRAGYRLHALVPAQRSLEDLFVELVRQ